MDESHVEDDCVARVNLGDEARHLVEKRLALLAAGRVTSERPPVCQLRLPGVLVRPRDEAECAGVLASRLENGELELRSVAVDVRRAVVEVPWRVRDLSIRIYLEAKNIRTEQLRCRAVEAWVLQQRRVEWGVLAQHAKDVSVCAVEGRLRIAQSALRRT